MKRSDSFAEVARTSTPGMFGSIDSFTGLDFQLGAQAAQPQTEAGLWLSNSIHPSMATPDKVTFRRNYQRHRMGVAVVYNPVPKADDEHEGGDSFGSALMELMIISPAWSYSKLEGL